MSKKNKCKNCEGCGTTKTTKDRAREIYLCKPCSESIEYKLICKSHIKNDYFITENKLTECEYYIINRGSYPSMILYHLKDVIQIFATQYELNYNDTISIKNKMDELQNIKIQKKIERQEKAEQKRKFMHKNKKTKLAKAMDEYGLQLREDSKLCNGYINGTINDWTIDEIVERMCQMKYLYDYCDMNDCCEQAYEEQQDEYRAGYFPDCTVFEQAEMIALKKHGKYPDQWPWLEYE